MRLAVTDALRTLKRSLAAKDAAITALEAENAALMAANNTLQERLRSLERLDEARWAVDHIEWPDGKRITDAEQAAARDLLRADRKLRSSLSLSAVPAG